MSIAVNISVAKSDVYAEVSKTTAYEGAHAGTFDGTFAKPEDQEMLERYWKEGTAYLTDLLKKYIPEDGTIGTDTAYAVTLNMPSNYSVLMAEPLESAAYTYLCNFITGKWMEMLTSDKAAAYTAAAANSLKEMERLFLHRVAPTRPTE